MVLGFLGLGIVVNAQSCDTCSVGAPKVAARLRGVSNAVSSSFAKSMKLVGVLPDGMESCLWSARSAVKLKFVFTLSRSFWAMSIPRCTWSVRASSSFSTFVKMMMKDLFLARKKREVAASTASIA